MVLRSIMRTRISKIHFLTIIIALGFVLRIHQLGHDSFWIDEVGVAVAVSANTIPDMLGHKYWHVMSMPLDYVVLWFVARLGTSEFLLRLPAALWGTLAIPATYLLVSRLKNDIVALWTAILLALSPFHVQYSQEARFYTSLVFFYILSHLLLYKAVTHSNLKAWTGYTIITILGVYFHVFVILTLITGFLWSWFVRPSKASGSRHRIYFILSSIIILGFFLVAVFTFGTAYTYDIPLLIDSNSIISILAIGFGWLPFFPGQSYAPYYLGAICLLFAVSGVVQALRQPRSFDLLLLVSINAQITAIITMNILRSYFILPRQFIILLPILLYFTAMGLVNFAQFLVGLFNITLSNLKITLSPMRVAILAQLSSIVILALLALPALQNYYQSDKGQAREIAGYLQTVWQPGDTVLVIPDFELQYHYYLARDDPDDPILAAVYGSTWDRLEQDSDYSKTTYLIAPVPISEDQQQLIDALSFDIVRQPDIISQYSRQVWRRVRE
jgi:mannosyltransferase